MWGMAVDTAVRRDLKVAYGTKNMTKEPAMSREEAVRAVEAGIAMAEELREKGYTILATGEMGIEIQPPAAQWHPCSWGSRWSG